MQAQARSVRLFMVAAVLGASAACERTPDALPYEVVRSWKLPGEVASIDLSSDGQSVLLGSATGESSLWTSPWNLSVPFDRVAEPLLAARFSNDGHLLFLRAHGAIEVRSDNGAILLDPHIRLKRPSQFALPSPNGRYVAFDTSVYDIEAMRLMVQAEPGEDQRGLAFAGDRMVLITRAHHPQLTVLRLDGRESVLRHAPDEVMAGAISHDGRYIAAGTTREVLVWEAEASVPVCERQTKAPIEALHFSGSARWLAALSGRRLLVLNAVSCEPLMSVPLLDGAAVLDVDGDLIAVADASANIYVWDVFNVRMIGLARVFGTKVSQLRLHAASRSLLVAANGAGGAEVKLLRITGR
jgi:WD40 repeat protein